MRYINENDIKDIVLKYNNGFSIEKISNFYHIGERRVKKILKDNGVVFKTIKVDERFPEIEGKHYVAISKIDKTKFLDYLNKSGSLTTYIKNNVDIDIPSLFKRNKFYEMNGFQWYEQWFDIVLEDDIIKKTKKCPYCNWETIDVNNKSGMFFTHLLKEHGITREKYIEEHPEDKEFYTLANKTLELQNEKK